MNDLILLKNEDEVKNLITEIINSTDQDIEELESMLGFSFEFDWRAEENDGKCPWLEGSDCEPCHIKKLINWNVPCIAYVNISKTFDRHGDVKTFVIVDKSLEELGLKLGE
jgi:hypothetical protein